MLDYRTLPFISSQSAVSRIAAAEPPVHAGRRVRARRRVRGLRLEPGAALRVGHRRLAASRRGVRAAGGVARAVLGRRVDRDGERFRVYFLSDRGGIYALGYPVITWVGHLINLAELVVLAAVLYLAAARRRHAVQRARSRTAASGRALLREVRSSFYRKLFLAFVAGAVVPVVILAIFTRTYFADQLARRRRRGGGARR